MLTLRQLPMGPNVARKLEVDHLAYVLGAPHADSLILAHVERAHVYAVLGATGGNLTLCARALVIVTPSARLFIVYHAARRACRSRP